MTEMVTPKEHDYSQEIANVQAIFNTALFNNLGDKEFFSSRSDGYSMTPSAEVLSNEVGLKKASSEMFSFIKELLSLPEKKPHVPTVGIVFNREEVTTFSFASIERKQNPNEKTYPQPQLWMSEYGLIDVDKQRDPDLWAMRKDNKLAAKRDEILNAFLKVAEKNTPAAAEQRERVLKYAFQLSKVPIEIDGLQYQEVEEDHTFTPKIGIKIIRYLDGYQAFPTLHQGKVSVPLYDRPLFRGENVKIEEIGAIIELNLISEEELQATDLNKIFQAFFSKVDFENQR